MQTALSVRDLSVVGGEPRVLDIALGKTLGFQRPRAVRQIIDRHRSELRRYGSLSPQPVANKGKGRVGNGHLLNEGQALLVCMFAGTDNAADVREQLIRLFIAWRSGQLVQAPQPTRAKRLAAPLAATDIRHPDFKDPLLPVDGRRAMLERLHAFDGKRADDTMIHTITHLLTPSGPGGNITWPRWYHDKEVLTAVVQTHRQATLERVQERLKANFGWRAPSKSSLHRFWLRLDGLFGTGRKLH